MAFPDCFCHIWDFNFVLLFFFILPIDIQVLEFTCLCVCTCLYVHPSALLTYSPVLCFNIQPINPSASSVFHQLNMFCLSEKQDWTSNPFVCLCMLCPLLAGGTHCIPRVSFWTEYFPFETGFDILAFNLFCTADICFLSFCHKIMSFLSFIMFTYRVCHSYRN